MAIVEVAGLVKVFGGGTRAVDGVSFDVDEGALLGFLGPNGAGKTTTIRILTTLLRPTAGSARVAGFDVVRAAHAVRRRIGFAMQTVAVDNLATGRENLELIGRLHRVPEPELRRRVDELLGLMGLADVARRPAGTYSGGMRRRLDLASALVHRPEVLFLDEPTEGLDPQSRAALWDELARINNGGTTMILTTHYMEEADRLCGRIAIIDAGRIVVEGPPDVLKRGVGMDTVAVRLGDADETGDRLVAAQDEVARLVEGIPSLARVERVPAGVVLGVSDAGAMLPEILRRLDAGGVRVAGLAMSRPTLDDVFLHHTGRRIPAEAADRPLDLGWWG